MPEPIPDICLRYTLTLAQAQEGFLMATRSKSRISQYVMQLGCLLIVVWGLWLIFAKQQSATGWYFVILGFSFLVLQLLLRLVVLPSIFKSQYRKKQVPPIEQGLDISQQSMVLWHGQQQQRVALSDVESLQKGKQVYLLTLKSGTVVMIPQQAVQQQTDVSLFERVFS